MQSDEVRGDDSFTAGAGDEHRDVNSGKRALATGKPESSSSGNNKSEDLTDASNQAGAPVDHQLIRSDEDLIEDHPEDIGSLNLSDTDEDEDEGLGDGRIGRTVRGDLK